MNFSRRYVSYTIQRRGDARVRDRKFLRQAKTKRLKGKEVYRAEEEEEFFSQEIVDHFGNESQSNQRETRIDCPAALDDPTDHAVTKRPRCKPSSRRWATNTLLKV